MNKTKTILLLTILVIIQNCRMTHNGSEKFKNNESQQLYKLAQEYQFKGQLDSALIYFDLANNSTPNTAIILHARGLLKSNMRNYEEAIIDLNKSVELTTDQKQKEVRISNRALTYMEMGNMKEACNDWRNSGRSGKSYIDRYCK